MDMTTQPPLRTGQLLVGALLLGMLTFSGVAFAMAGKMGAGSTPNPGLADMLLIVLGVLGISQLAAYHIIMRPIYIKQIRAQAANQDESSRPAFIDQRFLALTLIAAALAEGCGLFGAIIVLLTGRLEALIATGLAALALLLILPTRDRLERFTRQVSEQPFPR